MRSDPLSLPLPRTLEVLNLSGNHLTFIAPDDFEFALAATGWDRLQALQLNNNARPLRTMTPEPTEKQRYEKRRWQFYGGALILLMLLTVGEVAFYYDQGLAPFFYIASCLTMGGGVLAWCIYDSLARGFPLSHPYRRRIGMLGPLFVPAYFYQSRGMRQSAKSLFGLTLYVPFYAVFYATWYLAVEIMTWMGYFSR